MADYQPEHVSCVRPQRHPNSNLVRSLCDRVAHYTVQTDCRKDESYPAKDSEKKHCEALLLDGSGDDLIERPYARDRLFLIEGKHLAADWPASAAGLPSVRTTRVTPLKGI